MPQQESKMTHFSAIDHNSNMDRSDVTFKREGARDITTVLSVRPPGKTAGMYLFVLCHTSVARKIVIDSFLAELDRLDEVDRQGSLPLH